MTTVNSNPGAPGEFRVVPLSSLQLRAGFNPRTIRDTQQFARMVHSIREQGVLQPILVTPDGREDAYYVVAGEGRYLAAGEAQQVEVPVFVCEVDERTRGLELAMIENIAREDLDPVAEARGYDGLRAAGWAKKKIAEFFGVSQKLVTERLAIVELPEDLHSEVASGEIPLSAVKPLVELGKVHPQLPQTIVSRVGMEPAHSWEQPLGWQEVVEDPIGALLSGEVGEEEILPCDVYDAAGSYPVSRFSLTEKASKDLRSLAALLSVEPDEISVRFGRERVEQALTGGAAHPTKNGWNYLIVGQPVADQLASDCVMAKLREQRRVARARREQDKRRQAEAAARNSAAAQPSDPQDAATQPSEEERKEQARREREADREAQRKAVAFNLELGAAIVKHFARVKLDERTIKVLTATDLDGEFAGIAARGARYGFPGWAQQEQKKQVVKTEYLAPNDAAKKAREYLDGAKTAAEVAGRSLALLTMTRYADERCVPRTRSAQYELTARYGGRGVPWNKETIELLEQIAEERLPDHLTATVREERERNAELKRAEQRASEAANELRGRLDEMTSEQRLQALQEFDEQHGRHRIATHWLRQDILRRNSQDATRAPQPKETGDAHLDEPVAEEPDSADSDGVEPAVDGESAAAEDASTEQDEPAAQPAG